jgi:hypothetical protein
MDAGQSVPEENPESKMTGKVNTLSDSMLEGQIQQKTIQNEYEVNQEYEIMMRDEEEFNGYHSVKNISFEDVQHLKNGIQKPEKISSIKTRKQLKHEARCQARKDKRQQKNLAYEIKKIEEIKIDESIEKAITELDLKQAGFISVENANLEISEESHKFQKYINEYPETLQTLENLENWNLKHHPKGDVIINIGRKVRRVLKSSNETESKDIDIINGIYSNFDLTDEEQDFMVAGYKLKHMKEPLENPTNTGTDFENEFGQGTEEALNAGIDCDYTPTHFDGMGFMSQFTIMHGIFSLTIHHYPQIYECLQKMFMTGSILEIGGWPHKRGWFFNSDILTPTVDPQSVYENLTYFNNPNKYFKIYDKTVSEYFKQTTLVKNYKQIFMINTIQYLTIEEIETLIENTPQGKLFVFTPDYSKTNLKTENYKYNMDKDDNYSITSNGLTYTVDWQSINWLYTTNNRGKFTWTKVGVYDDHELYVFMFKTSRIHNQIENKLEKVKVEYINGKAWYHLQGTKRPVHIPDCVIQEATSRLVGRARDKTTFQSYLLDVRRTLKDNKVDLNDNEITAFATQTFAQNLENETELVNDMLHGDVKTIEEIQPSWLNILTCGLIGDKKPIKIYKGIEMMQHHKEMMGFQPEPIQQKWSNCKYISEILLHLFVILLLITVASCTFFGTVYAFNNFINNVGVKAQYVEPIYQQNENYIENYDEVIFQQKKPELGYNPALYLAYESAALWLLIALMGLSIFRCLIPRMCGLISNFKQGSRMWILKPLQWLESRFVGINLNATVFFNEPPLIERIVSDLKLQPLYKLGNSMKFGEFSELLYPTKRTYYKLIAPCFSKYLFYSYNNSSWNARLALVNRNAAENKNQPNMELLLKFKKWLPKALVKYLPELFDKNGSPIPINPLEWEDFVNTFPLTKRNKLNKAKEKSFSYPYNKDISIYSCFVKDETYPNGDIDGNIIQKDPRNINDPEKLIVVEIAPWIKAFANKLKESWNNSNSLFYSSGQNGVGIGKFFAHWQSQFGDSLQASETDFSRWEKTLSQELIAIELSIYEKFIPPEFKKRIMRYLRTQMTSMVFSKFGDVLQLAGQRKSGDPNTSVGNTLLNMFIHVFCYEHFNLLPHRDFAMVALGDDNATVFKAGKISDKIANGMVSLFCQFGLDPKFKIVNSLYQMEFCSGILFPIRLINAKDLEMQRSYILVPKFVRWLSKIGLCSDLGKETPEQRIYSILLGQNHLREFNYYKPYFKLVDELVKNSKIKSLFLEEEEHKYYTIKLSLDEAFLVDEDDMDYQCLKRYDLSYSLITQSMEKLFSPQNFDSLYALVETDEVIDQCAKIDLGY